MTQDNQPTYDMVAIAKQVEILKEQRNLANDDIAVLVGKIESLTQQNKELQSELDALKQKIQQDSPVPAEPGN